MSNLVVNPEDRFSHNEAHMGKTKVQINLIEAFVVCIPYLNTGLDPGFLERGLKFMKGGSFC